MKRLLSLLACLALILCGCASPEGSAEGKQKRYTATFLELFDTVTTIVGMADSEEAFEAKVQSIRDGLWHYHRLFDIYNTYEGIINLRTVNDTAHISPVKVDSEIIELLEDCKYYYKETDGSFNPAMGSVLALWHAAREDSLDDPMNAYLPSIEELREAAKHTSPDDIIIDKDSSTVFFSDSYLKLDVGAVAKGWAVQKVCEAAEEGLLISVGGNVYATGPKDKNGSPWAVGIKNPDTESDYLHILSIKNGCVVTSGSYQRAYAFDGRLYHHIIDPDTLFPSEKWTSVSVVCENSGMADVLSTALFIKDLDGGKELLSRFGAEAMWVDASGNKFYSSSFKELIRN